jgi:solute carrier family 25 folate transporter 32
MTDSPPKQSNAKKVFIDWISGLLGGFVSVTICAPLDLARTRMAVMATTKTNGEVMYKGFFQTFRKIYHDEGFKGLYKGYRITAVSIPFFHSLYFSLYYHVKNDIIPNYIDPRRTNLINFTSAVLTGLVTDTLTNPFWVLRTRIQSEFLHNPNEIKYNGIIQGMRTIVKEEGFLALWKGLSASYVGLSHVAVLFPTYEYLKKRIAESKKAPLTTVDIMLASLASKLLAALVTYPHVVVRCRIQDSRSTRFYGGNGANHHETFMGVVRGIIKNEGVSGLYSGIKFDLVRVLPSNTITFLTFEYCKKYLTHLWAIDTKNV